MKEIHECIGDIGRAGSTIFSTLDMTAGFWQMPLHKDSQQATAFTIPGLGQFQWNTSPMGLLGCPASFQRLMEFVTRGIKNILVYIDDLLIHSKTHPEHLQILEQLFKALRKYNMKVNLQKCVFGAVQVSYLGFRLTPDGILPGKDKLTAIKNQKPPTDTTAIRAFIGLCNFFRAHIKNFSRIVSPLNKLIRKDSGYKNGPLPDEAMKAFLHLQNALISDPIVCYPRSDRTYALFTDASTGTQTVDGGLGAILTQIDEKGDFKVISYASRTLATAEKNYPAFLLEMRAATWGMDHFSEYIRGKHFKLFTDHKPLEKMATKHSKTLNQIQLLMSEYDFEIQYQKGSEMPADFLSRYTVQKEIETIFTTCESFDFEVHHKRESDIPINLHSSEAFYHVDAIDIFTPELKELHKTDKQILDIKKVLMDPTKNMDHFPSHLRATYRKGIENNYIENDLLWYRHTDDHGNQKSLIFVPHSYRKQLMCEAHGSPLTGHGGIQKTQQRLLQSYYWFSMVKDIKDHIESCLICQAFNKSKQPKTPLGTLPQTSMPNQRIHVDLFGPMKTSSKDSKFLLCMTDSFSKYAEVVAIPNKEAVTVANAIFSKWICRFGCPVQIHSDNGKEFINKLSKELFSLLDIKHTHTSPSHPQCNAQVEVFNKHVAKYLQKFCSSSTLDWETLIEPMVFSYNTQYHRSIKCSPYQVMYGMEPRLPSFPAPEMPNYSETEAADRLRELQITRHIAMEHNIEMTDKNLMQQQKSASTYEFQVGQLVYYNQTNFLHKNRKLAQNWIGPVSIRKVLFPNLEIVLQNGKRLIIHVDRVKPFKFPESHNQEKLINRDEKIVQETQSDLTKKNGEQKEIKIKTKEIKTPHHMETRSKAKLNISLISSQLTPQNKYKLEDILIKHHSQIELTQSETTFWHTFDPETKYLLLTGDSWHSVALDTTKFISFGDCPRQLPAPVLPPAPPVLRQPAQLPVLPAARPQPFAAPIQRQIITDAKPRYRQTVSSDDSDQEEFDSAPSSPEDNQAFRPSRKDLRTSELLSNQLLATERQNITRTQAKKKIRTPPATPNQWPPQQQQQEEEEQRGSCTQQ